MKIKLMAISDTHLGEPTSLLSYAEARWHLIRDIRRQFGVASGKKLQIEELVLVGDIVDSCLASSDQCGVNARILFDMLAGVFDVGKVVYLPGNHDHTLWSAYRVERQNQGHITEPEGDVLLRKGVVQPLGESAKRILSVFSHPDGYFWKSLEAKQGDFSIANPVYAKVIGDRTYVFAHGTHFRPDVIEPEKAAMAFRALGIIINRVGQTLPAFAKSVAGTSDMSTLEKDAAGFVDWVWANAGNLTNPPRDKFWYAVTQISGRLGHHRKLSPSSDRSQLYSRDELSHVPRIKPLVKDGGFTSGSLKRWQSIFLVPMMKYLSDKGMLTSKMTFVYGDTHEGGYGEAVNPDAGTVQTLPTIRIYNTGAWVVDAVDYHPPCHIFAVGCQEPDGPPEEYIFDASFVNVIQDGLPLLTVAQRDVENLPSALIAEVAKILDPLFK